MELIMLDKSAYSLINELTADKKEQLLELYRKEYWSKNRTKQDLETILAGSSFVIGIVHNEMKQLVGFTRILTDTYKYAFVFDVIVDQAHRGQGLGQLLVDSIVNHPKLASVRNIELTCMNDMVEFYEQYDFSSNFGASVPMRRTNRASNAS
jgi:predicted GNAT family N-acyltransferase